MKGSNLSDFVFGVVNRRPPGFKADLEELKKNQLAIRGLKWLSWCTENVTAEQGLGASASSPKGNLQDYELTFQQFHGEAATREHLLKELETLQEFVWILDGPFSLLTWWKACFSTLQRVFLVSLESSPSLQHPCAETCLSLVHAILTRASFLMKNAEGLYEPFLYLCRSVCKVLLMERQMDQAKLLSQLMVQVHLSSQEGCRTETHKPEDGLSSSDCLHLTAACCCALEPHLSLQYLNRIQNPYYHHRMSYFKVCLLIDCGEYDKALNLSASLTGQSAYKQLPLQLRPHLCDAVGTCLYKTGMHYESVDWFSKAVSEEPSHMAALLHMADAYRSLKNVSAERAALRVMAQGSLNITASGGDQTLTSSIINEASLSEALYILGFRLLAAGFHDQAADIFDNFVRKYDAAGDYQWNLIKKPKVSQIYVEAAHAHLRAKRYSRCKELVSAVLGACPDTGLDSCAQLFRQPSGNASLMSGKDSSDVWKTCAASYFASLIQAVASMVLNQGVNEEAEDVLRRMLSAFSVLHKEGGPPDLNQDCEEQRWLLELVSQAYGNVSVLRLRRELNMDALHSLKASLIAWPENLDSLYNYVLLLLKLEKNRKALQVWNTAKGRGLDPVLRREESSHWQFNVTLEQLKVLDGMLS